MKPHNFLDLKGQRFGRLTVIGLYDTKNGKSRWLCKCDCGNSCTPTTSNLRSGTSTSCGCVRNERIAKLNLRHGEYNSPLYKKWRQMINRCKPEYIEAKSYFYRGIGVCNEWKDFLNFRTWALLNGYQNGYSLERKDVNKGYLPENCCWIPLKEQARNKQNTFWIEYRGEKKSLIEWCELLHLKYSKIYKRIHYRHWDIERAFTTP